MLFNSFDFAIFLPIVFIIYWFLLYKNLKLQNAFILLASYIFYGWWDWRFLLLIAFSTFTDFLFGILICYQNDKKRKKLFLALSLLVNLGILGYFKYFNFFVENFIATFTFFGYSLEGEYVDVILPVGISFYTFQTLSYSIDIYRNKLTPTRNFIEFAAYVSFFPQLVAGPIERATNLLPQFQSKRAFNPIQASNGLRQILWGLVKKIMIADNCARIVNPIFESPEAYNGSTLLLGAILFAFQIYGDFSGYSDIAIGTARLFGFNLMQNFAFPYFSRDIGEFWRRWHISLSTWFRDYVYIPLGGSKFGKLTTVRNTLAIFLVSGFWHGANWTFIIWGFLHAILFLPLILLKHHRHHLDVVAGQRALPTLLEVFFILLNFILVCLLWVIFRAESLSDAVVYLQKIFTESLFQPIMVEPYELFVLLSIFITLEWIGRKDQFGIETFLVDRPWFVRWPFYHVLIVSIYLFGNFGTKYEFIYFQF